MYEFEVITRHFLGLTENRFETFGLNDDAALLVPPKGMQLVCSKDVLQEGIHFIGNETPEALAIKMLAVNLSDMAAMGAEPYSYMMGLGLPSSISKDWIGRFAYQLGQEQKRFRIYLTGGDTTNSLKHISLSCTMFGMIPKSILPLRRMGARVGDLVYVSGNIGDAALGLLAAKGQAGEISMVSHKYLLKSYQAPSPQVQLGLALRDMAHTAIDISDGMVQDLLHICRSSEVGAEIKTELIPLSKAAKETIKANGNIGIDTLITGGDDYQLLFTIAEEYSAEIKTKAKSLGVKITQIGKIIDDNAVNVIDENGNKLELKDQLGWQHCFG